MCCGTIAPVAQFFSLHVAQVMRTVSAEEAESGLSDVPTALKPSAGDSVGMPQQQPPKQQWAGGNSGGDGGSASLEVPALRGDTATAGDDDSDLVKALRGELCLQEVDAPQPRYVQVPRTRQLSVHVAS